MIKDNILNAGRRESSFIMEYSKDVLKSPLMAWTKNVLKQAKDLSSNCREELDDYLSSPSLNAHDLIRKVNSAAGKELIHYMTHRRLIIDLLEDALNKNKEGKYEIENFIHELILPVRKDNNGFFLGSCNLWLIDERLSFHHYLASDKPLKSMPIINSVEANRPDIISLNIYDNPLLMSEQQTSPSGSISIVEIKRPMRNDAQARREKDPIDQTLGYLEKIRGGKITTASGRPITDSSEIPGFCYIVCDITEKMEQACKKAGLVISSDKRGYIGYNPSYKAYIEVISYKKLVDTAKKRNRAFFDKLGLPSS